MSAADPYANALARFYAFYIERPLLARAVGALTWGTSYRVLYRSLAALRSLPASVTVLDVCCGAGLALRWLDPSNDRYIGIDSSSAMLDRARGAARRRGFSNAEFLLTDVEAIPMPDGAADVALLYNALHAVPHSEPAAREVSRCLKPGAQLAGTMVVRGRGRRADRFMEREATKEQGLMGPGGTESDLKQWLTAAGFVDLDLSFDGPLAAFNALWSDA